mmetsp:Transcript_41/g.112  ORF Transcript_41/g.112 Transcript_41/m.112 type:complete len:211 (-) Transcript_41:474-1106(-)
MDRPVVSDGLRPAGIDLGRTGPGQGRAGRMHGVRPSIDPPVRRLPHESAAPAGHRGGDPGSSAGRPGFRLHGRRGGPGPRVRAGAGGRRRDSPVHRARHAHRRHVHRVRPAGGGDDRQGRRDDPGPARCVDRRYSRPGTGPARRRGRRGGRPGRGTTSVGGQRAVGHAVPPSRRRRATAGRNAVGHRGGLSADHDSEERRGIFWRQRHGW